MDLNSTSCTCDDFVFIILCDLPQCPTGVLKNGWNGGILFHDNNQSLSGYRNKWLGQGYGIRYGLGLGLGLVVRLGLELW